MAYSHAYLSSRDYSATKRMEGDEEYMKGKGKYEGGSAHGW